MSNSTLIAFAVTGGIACTILGLIVGRVITLKGFTWTLKDVIGVSLIGAFVAVLFILFWKEIPAKNEQLIVYMLGQLSGFVGGVISAHYVHKAGEDKLEAQRQETAKAQAEATKSTAEAVVAAAAGSPPSQANASTSATDAARSVADAADNRAEDFEQRGGS